jgi:hypothetical protein
MIVSPLCSAIEHYTGIPYGIVGFVFTIVFGGGILVYLGKRIGDDQRKARS